MVCLLTLAACGTAQGRVAQRASFELDCVVQEDDVRVITDHTYGVEACGCRAVYFGAGTPVLQSVSGPRCAVRTSGGQAAE